MHEIHPVDVQMGAYLRGLRMGRGVSVRDMSTRVGMNRTHIHAIERGARPITLKMAERWARALDMTIRVVITPKSVPEGDAP